MWSPVNPASQGGPPAPNVARTTIFGKSLVIKGEVSGSEPLQIEGRIEGSIVFSGNHVSIGRDAIVAANILAQEVVIRGTLRGNLTINDRVEIHGGGSVIGLPLVASASKMGRISKEALTCGGPIP
jgi:cytoskeletal protein CcmA (bactofilin family)